MFKNEVIDRYTYVYVLYYAESKKKAQVSIILRSSRSYVELAFPEDKLGRFFYYEVFQT